MYVYDSVIEAVNYLLFYVHAITFLDMLQLLDRVTKSKAEYVSFV